MLFLRNYYGCSNFHLLNDFLNLKFADFALHSETGHIVNCVNLTRFQILNYIILQYSGNLTISKPNTWMQIICTILPAHLVILSSQQYQVNNTDGLMYDRDIEFWICFWNDKVKRQCNSWPLTLDPICM